MEDLEPGGVAPSSRTLPPSTQDLGQPVSVCRRSPSPRHIQASPDEASPDSSTLAPTTNLPGSADSMVIVMETGAVNDKEEDPAQDNCDGRSVESDSFTTAASSLSLVDICKICHCGSEVSRENSCSC